MKKVIMNLVVFTAASLVFISCGTIMGKMSKVALVDAPRNLEAKADGENLEITKDLTVSNLKVGMNNDTYYDYFSPVVKLNKHKTVSLELSSGGSKGTVDLSPKFSGAYFFGNLFVTGLVLGTVVDVATKNHRQHMRYVDVPAILAGKPVSEWRSKHQLKKAIKKSARK